MGFVGTGSRWGGRGCTTALWVHHIVQIDCCIDDCAVDLPRVMREDEISSQCGRQRLSKVTREMVNHTDIVFVPRNYGHSFKPEKTFVAAHP